MNRLTAIGAGLGIVLLTAAITYWWGAWLEQTLLRPLAVAWVWFTFYVTHLPQAAVWFAMLALACLPLLKRIKLFSRARATQQPPRWTESKGPLSAWQHTLTLAIKGQLYRKKLHLYLQEQVSELTPAYPQAREILERLSASDRSWHRSVQEPADFLQALHALLDELDPVGAPHAAG